MNNSLLRVILQLILHCAIAQCNDLKNAILSINADSGSSEFPVKTLTFSTKISGQPEDFYSSNEERINKLSYQDGAITVSYLNQDVVGRFKFNHIPARTNFVEISGVRSIKDLELILGKSTYDSGFSRWGFFSYDGKGHYLFEFYVVSFNQNSNQIIGIRHGVASWPN